MRVLSSTQGSWNEAELLTWLVKSYPPARPGEGIGDDCALLPCGDLLLALTTDAVVEDVHFRRQWLSWAEVGSRAVRGCLSDLAAVCAQPEGVFLSVGLPAGLSAEDVKAFVEGAAATAAEFSAQLKGGDTVASSVFFADVVAVGRVTGQPWLRSGGREGDLLAVTGQIGGPAAAVALLEAGRTQDCSLWPVLRERFVSPTPRIREALSLAELDIHAAIDLSDGLMLDASRLAAASSLRAVVEAPHLPVLDGVEEAARLLGTDPLIFVAAGGEEYELLLAIPPNELSSAEAHLARLGCRLTVIGHLEAGTGAELVSADGQPVHLASLGWVHGGQS
ncbi:MAG: thiamine-phosphate kinase [Armatimonadetes bacterium]|nr:thiamine-phosphate kinase [Armatimonadota bacterium]